MRRSPLRHGLRRQPPPPPPPTARPRRSAEAALDAALREVGPRAEAALAGRDYAGSLRALAALRTPVDAFFDGVMVNVEDAALRDNRLALLGRLHAAMNRVADLSRL